MATKEFIAAIELGSSKLIGMVGRKEQDGSLYVLATSVRKSSSFIRNGVIYNLNKTTQALSEIVKELEKEVDAQISQVYVGLGGKSLRGIINAVSRRLDGAGVISQELVDSIIDENISIPLVDMDILDVIPQEYRIGNNYQMDPVGGFGNSIEGHFLNVIARSSVKENLEKCFDQAGIKVVEYKISPLSLAKVMLTEKEMRSGCALVDMGAQTTTVAVYKGNILRHLAVIPLGGDAITRDICNLQVEEGEAESLKIDNGSAICHLYAANEEVEPSLLTLQDKRVIKENELNDIIEARVEEIIDNVKYQIELSGYTTQLLSGIVITGGGALLRDVEEAFRKRISFTKTRTMKNVSIHVEEDKKGLLAADGLCNTILGLLHDGELNCSKPFVAKPLSELLTEAVVQNSSIQAEKEKEEAAKAEEAASAKLKKAQQKPPKKADSNQDEGPSTIDRVKGFLIDMFKDEEM